MKFEPMLAATMKDIAQLEFPLLASPKLDGIRCVIGDGVPYSRNLKPIRNQYILQSLSTPALNGLDGELIVGSPTGLQVFNMTQSGVMKAEGIPKFKFYVFDDFGVHGHPFKYRLGNAEDRVSDIGDTRVAHVSHELIHSSAGLAKYEEAILKLGYEGVMLRDPEARYKFGRATEKEGSFWKVKRFIDFEAVVLEVLEGQTNQNEAVKDELGRTKRSTHQEGQKPSGLVGRLVCRRCDTGETINVSPGRLTGPQREYYLKHPKELTGTTINCRAFEYGGKDVDRFATFQSIRDPATMAPSSSVRLRATV
jgi:DNA ligase-1